MTVYTCPACNSAILIWYSGTPGVHIPLNGPNAGRCATCDQPFTLKED